MYGVGRGLNEGMKIAASFLMPVLNAKIAFAREDARLKQVMDYNLEWQRGIDGLPPSYHDEEEEADRAAATRPEIPSSAPTTKPGPMGVPLSRFDIGRSVQPGPTAPARVLSGAMGLIPPPSRRMMPRMRQGY